MTLSEYSRPNRVGYTNSQGSASVRVSFVTLPDPADPTGAQGLGDRMCFNFGKELYVYVYRGVKKVTRLTMNRSINPLGRYYDSFQYRIAITPNLKYHPEGLHLCIFSNHHHHHHTYRIVHLNHRILVLRYYRWTLNISFLTTRVDFFFSISITMKRNKKTNTKSIFSGCRSQQTGGQKTLQRNKSDLP